VLAIDDGQWFDADSALFMKGLIAASRGSALTVVISVRTQSDEPEAALEQLRVVAAHNPGGVEGITLTALDDAAVTSLISHVSASALDPARVSQLREEAKGSPWLAVQLARHPLHNDASSDVASGLTGERTTTLDQAARALQGPTCVAYAPHSREPVRSATTNPVR